MYTVYFIQDTDIDEEPRIFVCGVPSAQLAVKITDQLMDDFDVDLVWVEQD